MNQSHGEKVGRKNWTAGLGVFFFVEHIFSVRGLWWCRGKLRRSETVDSVEISIAIKTAACGGGPLNADRTKSVKFKREN